MVSEATLSAALIDASPALRSLRRGAYVTVLDEVIDRLHRASDEWHERDADRIDHLASGWGT